MAEIDCTHSNNSAQRNILITTSPRRAKTSYRQHFQQKNDVQENHPPTTRTIPEHAWSVSVMPELRFPKHLKSIIFCKFPDTTLRTRNSRRKLLTLIPPRKLIPQDADSYDIIYVRQIYMAGINYSVSRNAKSDMKQTDVRQCCQTNSNLTPYYYVGVKKSFTSHISPNLLPSKLTITCIRIYSITLCRWQDKLY